MDSRTQEQLAALPIPGGWHWQQVDFEQHSWRLLLPADADAFITEPAETGHWPDPYWAQLWPAAKSLAKLVLTRDWLVGTKVLELGCGSGFVGLAALARGCQVTFSDYIPLAVELAVANARGNGFEDVRGTVLDWRTPELNERFDAIVASDVLYDPELHQPLLETIDQLLIPNGLIWLADPGRAALAEAFVRLAEKIGWQISLFDERHAECQGFVRGEFRLLELRR